MNHFQPLVFSGVQPTGNLQLGNYLSALRQWVKLQSVYKCIYCVVDMHALTVNPNPEQLQHNTREVTATFLASGIDPQKHIIFNQSRVFQHAELAWIFNCIARIGWMNRMTQFKDKAGNDREKASLGLLAYPSLMAADILVYRATHVPVGDDQIQHLELTRDIAQRFNHEYSSRIIALSKNKAECDFFPMIQPLLGKNSMRIMSLRDGKKKMSKSDPSDFSRINLSDTADMLAKKIRKAKTDSKPLPETWKELENRAEARNLITIYAALAEKERETILSDFSGKQFSEFKPALIELLVETLVPIGSELNKLKVDSAYLDKILHQGADKASALAEKTMKYVREIVGFL